MTHLKTGQNTLAAACSLLTQADSRPTVRNQNQQQLYYIFIKLKRSLHASWNHTALEVSDQLRRHSGEYLQFFTTKKEDSPKQDDLSPQQVGGPDDGKVLAVHVGYVAECSQARKVPHEELQGPKKHVLRLHWLCRLMNIIKHHSISVWLCAQTPLEISHSSITESLHFNTSETTNAQSICNLQFLSLPEGGSVPLHWPVMWRWKLLDDVVDFDESFFICCCWYGLLTSESRTRDHRSHWDVAECPH